MPSEIREVEEQTSWRNEPQVYPNARPTSLLASLNHNTELATTTQKIQSVAVNPIVPKAF
jgi:hypothetical protein